MHCRQFLNVKCCVIAVESGAGCSVVPEFTGLSPAGGAVIHVLPFEEVQVNITVDSRVQRLADSTEQLYMSFVLFHVQIKGIVKEDILKNVGNRAVLGHH